MFKELVTYVHNVAHNFCLVRPLAVAARGTGCRPIVKNCILSNIIFFIAIFTPLYVCLLKDVLKMLRDVNNKFTIGK
ncbi:uncharacterized protein LOC26527711 [Drosophila mojavensis]|uniref:Uncharacterized protein n=1 Tax=Drosophila mojavensis TaxID=7230 RepID=A0A0Q9XLM1_DROMO|nr:uncharacterized protein LOC26527711 [Drosophila mojavensis]KRG05822.1 uncharacterized protein Dmoj_GI26070 [Drosophila mojavensis]